MNKDDMEAVPNIRANPFECKLRVFTFLCSGSSQSRQEILKINIAKNESHWTMKREIDE